MSHEETLKETLSKYSELFRKYGDKYLNGNKPAFQELKDYRLKALQTETSKGLAKRNRNLADVAWKSKNYKAVVGLYESIEDELTEVERKRLSYSKKMVTSI